MSVVVPPTVTLRMVNTGCLHCTGGLLPTAGTTWPMLRSVLHLGGMSMPENWTWQLADDWQDAPAEAWMACKVKALMRANVYTLCAMT